MPKIMDEKKPSKNETPKVLQPYLDHGIHLTWGANDKEAIGECPFCSRPKLTVDVKTGQYRCFVCAEGTEKGGGNVYVFLRKFHEMSLKTTKQDDYVELAKNRTLLSWESLKTWGVCKSLTQGEWLVPSYNHEGKLNNLYRYVRADGKMILKSTWGLSGGMFGLPLVAKKAKRIHLVEGPWDGIALWEVLSGAKLNEDGTLTEAKGKKGALINTEGVIAIPGTNSFAETWCPLLSGKFVSILFDNDHPKMNEQTGKEVAGGGITGVKRIATLLNGQKKPPSVVSYLEWGEQGFTKDLPNGTDVRDIISGKASKTLLKSLGERINAMQIGLVSRLVPVPDEFLGDPTQPDAVKDGPPPLEPLDCKDYRSCVQSWRKAMKWTDGLDHALAVMLACCTSTRAVGDQLWVKVCSPPSSGKTTLCEALSIARQYTYPKDTVTSLTSGYQSDADGSENLSLAEKLRDKTLIINDGDTLLQLPNLNQVLSQFRAFYGRNLRSQYGNKMSGDHEAINCTVLLCGTNSLRKLDTSELGERFLDCVIMDEIDDELEDAILWNVINKTDRGMALESNGKPEHRQEESMTEAMQKTGGYLIHLRENATDLLSTVEGSEEAKRYVTRLGKFVAFLRARPSSRHDETADRELAARLVSQHWRLAKCLAVVLNRNTIDEEVLKRTRRVALDTARGVTLEMCRFLYDRPEGVAFGVLKDGAKMTNEGATRMTRFLRRIGVLDYFTPREQVNGGKMMRFAPRYRLTEKIRTLYQDVMEER